MILEISRDYLLRMKSENVVKGVMSPVNDGYRKKVRIYKNDL